LKVLTEVVDKSNQRIIENDLLMTTCFLVGLLRPSPRLAALKKVLRFQNMPMLLLNLTYMCIYIWFLELYTPDSVFLILLAYQLQIRPCLSILVLCHHKLVRHCASYHSQFPTY